MVTTTKTGRIVVWDLGEKKLQTIIKNAHNGEIGSARFFPNEPILMTAGDDNAVKVTYFLRCIVLCCVV
jgi:U3 small nucleolar RNA-associated protein 21